jgi:hypothetical protein
MVNKDDLFCTSLDSLWQRKEKLARRMAQLLDLQTPFLHSNNSGLEVAKTRSDSA